MQYFWVFYDIIGFYKNYAHIVSPLTSLLKKKCFEWNESVTLSFSLLKDVMSSTPILANNDFGKTFIVKCDASRHEVGVAFMHEGRLLAFESKQFKGKYLVKSTYEKEMVGILQVVKKW